jgi:HD superfamily phosphohydrolase
MRFKEIMFARLKTLDLDPTYHFVEDTASDTPYEPYEPDAERPTRQILVENDEGRIVEIGQQSEALQQLSKTYTVMRYYAPAWLREEMRRALQMVNPGR